MFGKSAVISAYEKIIGHYEGEIQRLNKINKELMDRLMSKNFEEYQAYKDPDQRDSENANWPIIPQPGTIAPYEADAHEIG